MMTIKEINERKLAIAARKQEIETELREANEDRIKELDIEVDGLIAEEGELRSKEGLAGKLRKTIEKPEERFETNERETRAKELREKRAVTIASGQLAQPKETGGINDGFNEVSSIVDLVNIQSAVGMLGEDVAYQKQGAVADKTAEGGAAHESDAQFNYAKIRPVKITTYSEVSEEATKLTDLDYLSRVERSAYNALRKKAGEYILNSDDQSNPTFVGIFKSETIDASSDIEVDAIDERTLRRIVMHYGGDENIVGGGVLILNKADLVAFGDVRGTNEKKYIYEITPDAANPNTGVIKDGGLAVRYVINSSVKGLASAAAGDYFMAYGAPGCFQMNLFSEYEVKVSEEAGTTFRNGMLAIRGMAMLGGNVTVHNGFVRVKKKAAAAGK